MIVIALAALAYTWFSGVFSTLTSQAGAAVTSTTGQMATQFKIEVAKYISGSQVNYTIRNIGTQTFDVSKTNAFIGGAPASMAGWTCTPACTNNYVPIGGTVNIQVSNTTAACLSTGGGKTMNVNIATGLQDSVALAGC